MARHVHIHLGGTPTRDAEWEEGKHPRADNGKFGHGAGGAKPPEKGKAPAAQHMTYQEHARQAVIHRTNWNKYKAQRARVPSGSPEARELDAKMKAEHAAMVMHTQRGNAKRPTGAN